MKRKGKKPGGSGSGSEVALHELRGNVVLAEEGNSQLANLIDDRSTIS